MSKIHRGSHVWLAVVVTASVSLSSTIASWQKTERHENLSRSVTDTGFVTELFTGHDTTRGSGHEVLKNLTGRVGSGLEVFEI